MMVFIKKLRQLVPKMIISQPAYGFPQVKSFWVNEMRKKDKMEPVLWATRRW